MSQALMQSQPLAQRHSERRRDAWRAIAVSGLLVFAVLVVFSRTLSHGFLNWDDGLYVYDEPHVSGGFSWSGIVWAFTSHPVGEWYPIPLSTLSHMLDCQLYGLHPAGHHFTNLVLHAASAVALFLILWRMTEALWPSAMVAALFAVHPLHVESVAWVSERRDVLSGLCFMLTLGAYGEYVRHPHSLGRYLAVVGLFALGLTAKPMLVTVPPLLLLLDFWPLGRFGRPQPDAVAPSLWQKTNAQPAGPAPLPWRPIVDKLPLLALSIAAASATLLTRGTRPEDPLTLPDRLAGATISCVAYLGQLFVPVGLSAFYAHPEAGRPAWQVVAALALLLAITAAAVIVRRTYPYLFVGWFWYLGMLVPVLGLTRVGPHARADRYTYLSQIGLYIALIWLVMRLGASWPARRWVFGIGSAVLLAALMACSWRQTGFWRNDQTLWEHALACDSKDVTAHYYLGAALDETDQASAVAHYWQALEMGPRQWKIYHAAAAQAHNGLGNIADRNGDPAEAIDHYAQALKCDSSFTAAHLNIGSLLVKQGRLDEAIVHFQRGLELAPGSPKSNCCMGAALSQQGKDDEAIAYFRKAVDINPKYCLALTNLAILLAKRDKVDEAIAHFHRAIAIDPDGAACCYQIAKLLRGQGESSEAAKYEEQGRKASRRYAESQNLRGTELARQGKLNEAIARFRMAIAAAPDDAQAHCNLADALASQGNIDGAIAHYRQALEIDSTLPQPKQHLQQFLNQ